MIQSRLCTEYNFIGEYVKAERVGLEALEFYKESGNQHKEAEVSFQLGCTKGKLGKIDEGLKHLYLAKGLFRKLGRDDDLDYVQEWIDWLER